MAEVVVDVSEGGSLVSGSFDSNLFYVDKEKVGKLKEVISHVIQGQNNAIDRIYNNVTALANGWEGEDYNTYKSNLDGYRKYLDTYVFFLQAYNNLLTQLNENIGTLETNINNALNIG